MKKFLLCILLSLGMASFLFYKGYPFEGIPKITGEEYWGYMLPYCNVREVSVVGDRVYLIHYWDHGTIEYDWIFQKEIEKSRTKGIRNYLEERNRWVEDLLKNFKNFNRNTESWDRSIWGPSLKGRRLLFECFNLFSEKKLSTYEEVIKWWKKNRDNFNPTEKQIKSLLEYAKEYPYSEYKNYHNPEMDSAIKKVNQRKWWLFPYWCFVVEALYFSMLIFFLAYGFPWIYRILRKWKLWRWLRFGIMGVVFHLAILLPYLFGYAYFWDYGGSWIPPQPGWIVYHQVLYFVESGEGRLYSSRAEPFCLYQFFPWLGKLLDHLLSKVLEKIFYPFLFYLTEPRWPISIDYSMNKDLIYPSRPLGWLIWGTFKYFFLGIGIAIFHGFLLWIREPFRPISELNEIKDIEKQEAPLMGLTTPDRIFETPWAYMEPLRVGSVPTTLGTPNRCYLHEKNGEPELRIDLYGGTECYAFEEALQWRGWIVIGFGGQVHFVSPKTREVHSYQVPPYFGYLYPKEQFPHCRSQEDFLLVASGADLWRFDSSGKVVWRSKDLGIDGVVVHDIRDQTIYGDGEWDPPGGWKPFVVALESGKRLII